MEGTNMRRLLTALTAGLLLLAGTVAPALAGDTWCDIDPVVTLTTPAGHQVTVFVVDRGPIEHAVSLLYPYITVYTQPARGGTATDVTLDIVVPNDSFGSDYAVASEVWSGPDKLGVRYDAQSGVAGQTIRLRFTLNVP
jgi:hypothetical protein